MSEVTLPPLMMRHLNSPKEPSCVNDKQEVAGCPLGNNDGLASSRNEKCDVCSAFAVIIAGAVYCSSLSETERKERAAIKNPHTILSWDRCQN